MDISRNCRFNIFLDRGCTSVAEAVTLLIKIGECRVLFELCNRIGFGTFYYIEY